MNPVKNKKIKKIRVHGNLIIKTEIREINNRTLSLCWCFATPRSWVNMKNETLYWRKIYLFLGRTCFPDILSWSEFTTVRSVCSDRWCGWFVPVADCGESETCFLCFCHVSVVLIPFNSSAIVVWFIWYNLSWCISWNSIYTLSTRHWESYQNGQEWSITAKPVMEFFHQLIFFKVFRSIFPAFFRII